MNDWEDGFMGVDLLKHNQEVYEKVKLAITDGKKKIAIAHATGTGKSYLIAKLFEDFSNDKKLVLVPSTYISEQIKKLFEKYSIENIEVILYQKLIKMSDEDIAAMDYGVIALDEYHHDTSKVWGEKVRKLIDTHPESIIFGTSATPIRSDGVNTIDELFEGNCASDLPLSESIAKKIVPLPKYVGALYTLDAELEKLRKKIENATNTKEEKQEFYRKINTMRSQIEKSYGMPIILNKHIKNKEGKYIIFCKKKKHLREIKETVIGWFKTAGFKNINTYEVYSDYENKDAEYKAFCNDASNSLKLLFCVNMLNEGLHLEDISGVLLLRPTRSMLVFLQQIGRAIEANNTNTPVIIDAVNNFSSAGQGMKLLDGIKEAVAKEKESNPNFDDSRFEDIDTFFVIDQVVEIQEMFREIEVRLQGREWTEEEDKLLSKYYGHLSIEEIHNKYLLHRSKIAIQRRAQVLEIIYKKNSPMWTNEENEILRKYYPTEGLKVEERLENRTKVAIIAQISRLKLKFGKWTDEEIGILKKYYPTEGLRVKERLKNKTENAILRKSSELNIKSNRYWTEEEIDILKKYYPQYWKSINEFLPNKPISSIKNKARKLKIFADKKRKYKYVYKSGNKYMVRIFIDGQNKMFGTYDSEDEAGRVAMEKAKEYGKAI